MTGNIYHNIAHIFPSVFVLYAQKQQSQEKNERIKQIS